MEQKNLHIATRTVHSSENFDSTSAVNPPIQLSTTFRRNVDGSFAEYLYSRYDNPNRRSFEESVARLEGGDEAFAFSSGLASTQALFQTLKSGDHVLLPNDVYHGVVAQLMELFESFGVTYTRCDFGEPAIVEQAIKPNTRIVWTESPSNPLLDITDLEEICSIAHAKGAMVVSDNTCATPILQRPIEFGCDVVLHSATKFFGGHSDVLMGVVVVKGNEEIRRKLKRIQMIGGANPSPFDCWLASRGLKTLALRVREQSKNAEVIAQFLSSHSKVDCVYYPSLPSHRNHHIAARQMSQFGSMISILIKGGLVEAMKVANSTTLFAHATSLGSVESLIEHRRSVEGGHATSPDNLLRLSVGIEHADDLIADLEQALDRI